MRMLSDIVWDLMLLPQAPVVCHSKGGLEKDVDSRMSFLCLFENKWMGHIGSMKICEQTRAAAAHQPASTIIWEEVKILEDRGQKGISAFRVRTKDFLQRTPTGYGNQ